MSQDESPEDRQENEFQALKVRSKLRFRSSTKFLVVKIVLGDFWG